MQYEMRSVPQERNVQERGTVTHLASGSPISIPLQGTINASCVLHPRLSNATRTILCGNAKGQMHNLF